MEDVLYHWAWLDDRVVQISELCVPIPSPGVQYGMGLFEGLKAYPREGGVGIVGLEAHMRRMFSAAEASPFNFRPRIDLGGAMAAVQEVLKHNIVKEECYIRPCFVHEGSGSVALRKGTESLTHFAIYVQKWSEAYLKDDGVRCTVSGVLKPMFQHAQLKTCGNYVLCTEAKLAAIREGFDNCILRGCDGYVAEGASENLILHTQMPVLVSDDPEYEEGGVMEEMFIEPVWEDAPILPGITARILRETIGPDLGIWFGKGKITVDDLKSAKGVLMCGTAAETAFISELDEVTFNEGRPTTQMQQLIDGYRDLVEGRKYQEWVTHVTT